MKWNNEGWFLNDAYKDLKADFVIDNPPNTIRRGRMRCAPTRIWLKEILFMDGGNLGRLINRCIRELSPEDIQKITNTYHP